MEGRSRLQRVGIGVVAPAQLVAAGTQSADKGQVLSVESTGTEVVGSAGVGVPRSYADLGRDGDGDGREGEVGGDAESVGDQSGKNSVRGGCKSVAEESLGVGLESVGRSEYSVIGTVSD